MKMKFILLLSIIIFNVNSFAKPKIVVSTNPIAAILGDIFKDIVDISVIDAQKGCPHHYYLKPSDLQKIKEADFLVYIDEEFEVFVSKLLPKFNGDVIKISSNSKVNIIDINNEKNYHLWLDLDNILTIQNLVSDQIVAKFPEYKDVIAKNSSLFSGRLEDLKLNKQKIYSSIPNALIASKSLGHLFTQHKNIFVHYNMRNSSLSNFKQLSSKIKDNEIKYVIIDSNQDPKLFTKFDVKIIQIDSENWQPKKTGEYSGLFVEKYMEILGIVF